MISPIFSVPYDHGSAEPEAAVLHCLDPRFRRPTRLFVKHGLGIGYWDPPSVPGGVKAFLDGSKLARLCLEIPLGHHDITRVILVAHQDCTAYGGSQTLGNFVEEQSFQSDQLKRARDKAHEMFRVPGLNVELYYAQFSGLDPANPWHGKPMIEFVPVL